MNLVKQFFNLLGVVALFATSFTASSSEKLSSREEAIRVFYTSDIDAHTCKRVLGFSEGKVNTAECESKLGEANRYCKALIRETLPDQINEKQGILMVQIMMTCPFSQILNYPYKIVNGKPAIDFPK